MVTKVKTNVDILVLKGKANLAEVISPNPKKYVFKLEKDGTYYILKGYMMEIPSPSIANAEDMCSKEFDSVMTILEEFSNAKIASSLSDNYVKPLQISKKVEIPPARNIIKVFIETLYEYGGDNLSSYADNKIMDIKMTYNWMRQSAGALSLLHGIGISHLDIKPTNMVYDDSSGILKIIDLGSSNAYSSKTKMIAPTKAIDDKMRELTPEYSPPEVIQAYYLSVPPQLFIIGNIDIYCWGMTFYSLLCKKINLELENDIKQYKMKEGDYAPFSSKVIKEIRSVKANDSIEKKILPTIEAILTKALEYKPQNRQKMSEVFKEMQSHKEIKGNFEVIEKKNKDKLDLLFGINEGVGTNCIFILVALKIAKCGKCESDGRVELPCGHLMCTSCIINQRLKMKGWDKDREPIFECNVCGGKDKKISNFD